MKNTVRAPHNGGKTTPSAQAQTPDIREVKVEIPAFAEKEFECYFGGNIRRHAENIHQAVAQAVVLSELLQAKLDYRVHRGATEMDEATEDAFNFGFSLLSDHVNERLKQASDAMMKAAYAPVAAVAAGKVAS